MPELWAGIDAGKAHHHCVLIDNEGNRLLSRRVANDETALTELLTDVQTLAAGKEILWATDLNRGGAALLIGVLEAHHQTLVYIPGRSVYHAARTYRGDGKSDAKDAAIIADQARMRRDLHAIRSNDQISTDLRLLISRRTDLVCDRTRAINRLCAILLEYFPALEAAFDYAMIKAAVVLLTKYTTPAGIRRAGETRIASWLRNQGCYNAKTIASRAVAAARAQDTTVQAQEVGAELVAALARTILDLHGQVAETEKRIEARFREHPHAEILLSMPGFGTLLASEFLAATGGDITAYDSVARLAGVAGLAPVPRDSGRISGNFHRPKRYDRRLLNAFYLAAQSAARYCPQSRTYYQRKRSEGKNHKQAVLSLARRRLNVLWAMLRDGTPYRQPSPVGF
ncbi:IS110 family transposase [Arthrobacter sp. MI7-26]|uniref:IS110 family transposase n=1 Tax=Arthrobacter sp. MI7-26 TaxID=2993653 RepID=UPI0022487FEA|nr:IS110 family transposase [Arthrobacter sp. MI7-26]MCX2748981.1 IS110 family transposase [Arthrobacter sp. MI7-26]